MGKPAYSTHTTRKSVASAVLSVKKVNSPTNILVQRINCSVATERGFICEWPVNNQSCSSNVF